MPWTLRDVDIDADVGGPNMEHGAGCEARLCDELPIGVYTPHRPVPRAR